MKIYYKKLCLLKNTNDALSKFVVFKKADNASKEQIFRSKNFRINKNTNIKPESLKEHYSSFLSYACIDVLESSMIATASL